MVSRTQTVGNVLSTRRQVAVGMQLTDTRAIATSTGWSTTLSLALGMAGVEMLSPGVEMAGSERRLRSDGDEGQLTCAGVHHEGWLDGAVPVGFGMGLMTLLS